MSFNLLNFFLLAAIMIPFTTHSSTKMFKKNQPIARIRQSNVCCPLDSVVFDGWASIVAGGEIVQWIWDLDGNGKEDTSCTSGELKIQAPLIPCSRVVQLWVKDNTDNISEPDSSSFHVINNPITTDLGNDTTIIAGVSLEFKPTITSNCSRPVRFEWDFNDDGKIDYKSSETATTSRMYSKPGRYYARLRIFDNFSNETGGIKIITVKNDLAK